MKAVVAAFNQEKALVGAFSVITNLRMELFEALGATATGVAVPGGDPAGGPQLGRVRRRAALLQPRHHPHRRTLRRQVRTPDT